jgi:hypothetical protein
MKQFNINRTELLELIDRTKSKKSIQINVFTYEGNGIEYIGLESRRIDYERDKENGVNHIEKLIESGHYGETSSNSGFYSSLCLSIILGFGLLKTLNR